MIIKEIKIYLQENLNFLYRIYINLKIKKQLKNEISFFGDKLIVKSKNKSIILFTTHKSASTFFDNFFLKLNKYFDHKYINFDYYNTFLGNNSMHKNRKILDKYFISKGIIYGPIRKYLQIKHIRKFKVILFIRDPRDILVSDYFSLKYSHNVINEKFINQKIRAKKLNLDQFVLKNAENYKKLFNQYVSLFPLDDFTLIKYNIMINDPKKFQSTLTNIFKLDKSKKEVKNFFKAELKQNLNKKINYYSHRKIGTINLYKKFLKQSTIVKLNKVLKPVLLKYKF